MSDWRVAVLIPARDEEDSIRAAVRSARAALCGAGVAPARRVVVVACDGCSDATAARARQALRGDGVVIEGVWDAAGRARRAAAEVALDLLGGPALDGCWLANTDADTTVPPDWVARQLRLADRGWAATLGLVRLAAGCARAPLSDLERAFHTTYLVGRGRHRHVHGANFGVSAAAYVAVGGWPPLALAEDHALARRLLRSGFPVASAADLVVDTSARLAGRAAGGFADDLRALADCA